MRAIAAHDFVMVLIIVMVLISTHDTLHTMILRLCVDFKVRAIAAHSLCACASLNVTRTCILTKRHTQPHIHTCK